jgi:hypothetical protein
MAARNYEDFLQVSHVFIYRYERRLSTRQCAIPVFEGLLPEPHNTKVLRLLFTFAHWHGLAKLRMHTDATLEMLDDETTVLGMQLRDFQLSTCSVYKTRELMREKKARERRENKKPGSQTNQDVGERRPMMFNLQTYKFHSLGDYVSTIKRYGTSDSFTSAIVSHLPTSSAI